jgi:hypothetical protein
VGEAEALAERLGSLPAELTDPTGAPRTNDDVFAYPDPLDGVANGRYGAGDVKAGDEGEVPLGDP